MNSWSSTQTNVAGVEGTHCGHEANGKALEENIASPCAELRHRPEDLHLLETGRGSEGVLKDGGRGKGTFAPMLVTRCVAHSHCSSLCSDPPRD